ncbi:UNVERIFIED_CONTAM: hypothetical protein K2H54_003829 [Gekko kuhli]
MGKSGVQKKKTASVKSKSVATFFRPEASPSTPQNSPPKMADATEASGHQDSPSSKRDIQLLKDDLQAFFKSSMTELLQPVHNKLEELTEGLGAAGRAAESALEMAEKVQTEVTTLKRAEAIMQTKISNLENRWRQLNLKFRGISEGAEQGTKDLPTFISRWLDKELKSNEDTKSHVKILVLLDLAPEAIEKRKLLKPFADKLLEAKIRFRWSATSSITVYREGSLLQASTIQTGLLLLQKLKVPLTTEETEALQDASCTDPPHPNDT